MLPPGYSRIPSKIVSPFGPAVWLAIADIQGVPRNMTVGEYFKMSSSVIV